MGILEGLVAGLFTLVYVLVFLAVSIWLIVLFYRLTKDVAAIRQSLTEIERRLPRQ